MNPHGLVTATLPASACRVAADYLAAAARAESDAGVADRLRVAANALYLVGWAHVRDQETHERLRTAQAAVVVAPRDVDARAVRLGVIEEAVGDGWSMNRVAASLGVSKQRVAQVRAGE